MSSSAASRTGQSDAGRCVEKGVRRYSFPLCCYFVNRALKHSLHWGNWQVFLTALLTSGARHVSRGRERTDSRNSHHTVLRTVSFLPSKHLWLHSRVTSDECAASFPRTKSAKRLSGFTAAFPTVAHTGNAHSLTSTLIKLYYYYYYLLFTNTDIVIIYGIQDLKLLLMSSSQRQLGTNSGLLVHCHKSNSTLWGIGRHLLKKF